jgi:hypothetical protein
MTIQTSVPEVVSFVDRAEGFFMPIRLGCSQK